MFGNLGPAEGVVAFAIFVAAWAFPLLLAIWCIRTVNAMTNAQRDIAMQLRVIAQALTDASHKRIT